MQLVCGAATACLCRLTTALQPADWPVSLIDSVVDESRDGQPRDAGATERGHNIRDSR